MKARIVIGLDGNVGIITDEGTLESGSDRIKNLLRSLNISGLDIELDGEIEQHRHDEPDRLHAHGGLMHSH